MSRNTVAEQLAIGDAIQRDAASKAQIFLARLRAIDRVRRRTTSSVTAWIEAARSMCRCSSGSIGFRGGPPKSRIEPRRSS